MKVLVVAMTLFSLSAQAGFVRNYSGVDQKGRPCNVSISFEDGNPTQISTDGHFTEIDRGTLPMLDESKDLQQNLKLNAAQISKATIRGDLQSGIIYYNSASGFASREKVHFHFNFGDGTLIYSKSIRYAGVAEATLTTLNCKNLREISVAQSRREIQVGTKQGRE